MSVMIHSNMVNFACLRMNGIDHLPLNDIMREKLESDLLILILLGSSNQNCEIVVRI